MISTNTVSSVDNIDELPRPATAIVSNPSASVLPRPVSTQPDIADTGRVTFGHSFRILSK
jgi:hypothetical protein